MGLCLAQGSAGGVTQVSSWGSISSRCHGTAAGTAAWDPLCPAMLRPPDLEMGADSVLEHMRSPW